MSNSLRHKKLISRINSLENYLLPPIKVTGNYSKKESDLIRSYVILVHAEIESFFEDIAKDKISYVLSKWLSDRKKSNCLLSIMAFCSNEINWEKQNQQNIEKIDFRVNRIVVHYINLLQKNHGIKSKNITDILLPLGVEYTELDQAWLSLMDNFGVKRGIFAHSTVSTQNQIDLVTEKNNINNNILPEISNIDLIVKRLK